jgi:hypothetical protein
MGTELKVALLKEIDGLMYYSESESLVQVIDIPVASEDEIIHFLAEIKKVSAGSIRELPTSTFFSRFENYIKFGRNDPALYDNALRFMHLYQFLQKNFAQIKIYKCEEAVNCLYPIYIILKTFKKNHIGLYMVSEET